MKGNYESLKLSRFSYFSMTSSNSITVSNVSEFVYSLHSFTISTKKVCSMRVPTF